MSHNWVCPKCGKKYNHPKNMSGLRYAPECADHLNRKTVTMVPVARKEKV